MQDRSLPHWYVDQLLSYRDGELIWRIDRNRAKAGAVAGTINPGRDRPYRMVKIDGRFYYAHKLVWLLHTKEWPESVDHIDGDGLNNRIDNLRLCTMSQNKANSRAYKNNKSGQKGVFKRGNKYRVSIQKDKKRIHLGSYDSLEDASRVYAEAAVRLFGEFARTG